MIPLDFSPMRRKDGERVVTENKPSPLNEEGVEQAKPAPEPIRKRTKDELYGAISRICRGECFMSIPVDLEKDADVVLSDGIRELLHLRDENEQQAATIRELQQQLAASRCNVKNADRRFMDAVAHPEEWSRLRARLLQNEAILGRYPWSQPGATTTTEAEDTETVTYEGEFRCSECGKANPPTARAMRDEDGKVTGFKCHPNCTPAPIKTEVGE